MVQIAKSERAEYFPDWAMDILQPYVTEAFPKLQNAEWIVVLYHAMPKAVMLVAVSAVVHVEGKEDSVSVWVFKLTKKGCSRFFTVPANQELQRIESAHKEVALFIKTGQRINKLTFHITQGRMDKR